MKSKKSLRFKLLFIYFVVIIIPVIIMTGIMPAYYLRMISEETRVLTKSTLSAVTSNIQIYLNDLERLTMAPYFSEEAMFALSLRSSGEYEQSDEYSRLVADRAIKGMLRNIFQNTRKDIIGTIILPYDGSVFATYSGGSPNIRPDFSYQSQTWYKKAVEADGKGVFVSPHPQDYLLSGGTKQVFSVARLLKNPYTQKPAAVIMSDADTVVIENIIKAVQFNVSTIVSIFDDNNHLIYSTEYLPKKMRDQIIGGQQSINGELDSYELISQPIDQSKWTMYVMMSHSEIISQVRWMYVMGILFAILGLALTFLIFSILSKRITDPFREMATVMRAVEEGNLKVRCNGGDGDEIARLGSALNNMIEQISWHIDHEYKAVLNQRNAEYRALQSQLQPHFLYNTLNGFVALNRMGDKAALEKGILSLTGMLRYILSHEDMKLIHEEFLFLERYCELQGLRFGERLNAGIFYAPETAAYRIPKLLLQPTVENAIIHGVEAQDRPVSLVIRAELLNKDGKEWLRLVVVDDGAGFDINNIDAKKSVGLSNTQDRLKIAYEGAVFMIESRPGEGTRVIIEIPQEELV